MPARTTVAAGRLLALNASLSVVDRVEVFAYAMSSVKEACWCSSELSSSPWRIQEYVAHVCLARACSRAVVLSRTRLVTRRWLEGLGFGQSGRLSGLFNTRLLLHNLRVINKTQRCRPCRAVTRGCTCGANDEWSVEGAWRTTTFFHAHQRSFTRSHVSMLVRVD